MEAEKITTSKYKLETDERSYRMNTLLIDIRVSKSANIVCGLS